MTSLNECNWLGNRPSEDDVMDWMAEVAKLRKRNLLLFEKSTDIARMGSMTTVSTAVY